MGVLDRGYIEGHEALVHCIRGAAWNPIDHLANMHSRILIRESADDDPSRAWAFTVDHYRFEDHVWASVDGALTPNDNGAIHVTVLHADVGPDRKCANCDTVVGTGVGPAPDFLAPWARPKPHLARSLGALV